MDDTNVVDAEGVEVTGRAAAAESAGNEYCRRKTGERVSWKVSVAGGCVETTSRGGRARYSQEVTTTRRSGECVGAHVKEEVGEGCECGGAGWERGLLCCRMDGAAVLPRKCTAPESIGMVGHSHGRLTDWMTGCDEIKLKLTYNDRWSQDAWS